MNGNEKEKHEGVQGSKVPVPSFWHVLWLMVRFFFSRSLGTSRILWLAGLWSIPVGLGAWWRFFEHGDARAFFMEISVNLLLQLFSLGLPLYLAVSAVRDEVEDRTITYMFVRPVRREVLLGSKIVSVALVVCAWLAAAALASYLVLAIGNESNLADDLQLLVRHILVLWTAAVIYTGLFAMFGLVLARPLLLAAIFGLGWEITVSNLPGAFPRLTIMYYLKSLLDIGPVSRGVVSLLVPSIEPANTAFSLVVLTVLAAVLYTAAFVTAGHKEYRL
ncbi:MAG: ABC transporter permease subunit [Deltaproteobacteria bacterium]|nr:ABC transporter permease subunit [Deltaproteobacteria bacterium]